MVIKKTRAFSMYGHTCDLELDSYEDDFLQEILPGNSIFVKLKRFFFKAILISPRFCKATTHIRSYAGVIEECRRQIQKHPYRIHPYSYIRAIWLILMCLTMVMELVTVPLDCLFSIQTELYNTGLIWSVMRFTIDIIFSLNVPVNLVTGYYDQMTMVIVLDFKSISKHYMTNSMLFDIITSFPLDWHIFFNMSNDILFFLRLTSTIKLLCIYTLIKYLKLLSHMFEVNFYTFIKIKLTLVVIAYYHAICCLYRYLKSLKDYDAMIGVKSVPLAAQNIWSIYLDALFDGSNIINNPETDEEYVPHSLSDYLITMSYWISSRIYCMYLLGLTMQIIKQNTSSKFKYVLMEKQLQYYMQQKQFPKDLQKKVLLYYHFRFNRRYFKEYEILMTLSAQLKHEIHMQSCRKLVESVVFFSNLPIKILVKIISCLKKEIYLPNDVIIRANTIGASMYFISCGSVAVYTKSGKEICHLQDGGYFGEVAILVKNTLRIASVVSLETSEVYRLDYKDFVTAIKPYPDLFAKIKQIAADRISVTEWKWRTLWKTAQASLLLVK